MKKRNRSRRKNTKAAGLNWLSLVEARAERRRPSWTFEQLEDRNLMAATPLQWETISSDTYEGQQLIRLMELEAAQRAAGANGLSQLALNALPTDPNLLEQWNMINVGQVVNPFSTLQSIYGRPGQDINVAPVWDRGITGEGILVAVVDSGIFTSGANVHPDLAQNLSLQYAFNALTGSNNAAPTGNSAASAHGTAVAGLIGAVADNGLGGVGVAYGSTVVPIKLFVTDDEVQGLTEQQIANAIRAGGAPIDIFNHSWGPFSLENPRAVSGPSQLVLDALIQSATTGRNGLGAIHVFSAGNNAGPQFTPGFQDIGFLDSIGSNGYASSRYVISVGAVDHDGTLFNEDGTISFYSEAGTSLLVVAPSASGPFDIASNAATGSGIFTTDLLNGGINIPPVNGVSQDVDLFPDTRFTTRFGGTSASAPLVSGVIALMLEADKAANGGVATLTYRDVQEILVRSARQNDAGDLSWIVNSTPFYSDPIRHNGMAPNYNNGGVYPDDEDAWNDEIIWRIIPGMITSPAIQAQTAALTSANGVTFSIHALENGPHEGTAGNDINVAFATAAGAPGASAALVDGTLRITVRGTPNWNVIKDAVDDMNGGGDFELIFAQGTNPNLLFSPADVALTGQLAGGADEEGEEPEIGRAAGYEGYNPVIHPLSETHAGPLSTNGAGYTVSQGWMTDLNVQYGYGHGVIDADLAVKLASQWNLKDQNLAPEKTVVRLLHAGHQIQGAEISEGTDAPGDESLVPGAVFIPGLVPGDDGGFIDYFQEFFKEPTIIAGEEGDPDAMPPVEGTEDSIDATTLPFRGENPPVNSRGTYYQVFGPDNMSIETVELQLDIFADANALDYLRITLVSPSGTHSELTHYTYTDDYGLPGENQQYWRGTLSVPDPNGTFYQSIDPPGTLDADADGDGVFSWTYLSNRHWGERADGVWQIRFENYGPDDLDLGDMRMIFHGQDVGPSSRVLGFVDDTQGYLGHAVNTTVYIKDAAGNRVSQFITGADGNYYFDVGSGANYTLGIDVPAGYRMAAGAPNEVPLMNGKRFVIEPIAPTVTQVTFSGQVFADLDGDGTQDITDAGVKDFIVYADLNHNGQFESGEPNTLTKADGTYSLSGNVTEPTIITIGIKPPAGWQVTNPVTGQVGKLASPNSTAPIIANFGVKPPANPTGQGNATIYGLVFNDGNGNGIQDTFETGIADLIVYIDDGDGIFEEAQDIFTKTTATGAYVFNDVAPGSVTVRVNVDSQSFQLTVPASGSATVTVVAGQVAQNILFGIRDLRTHDFGDLVGAGFRSSLEQDGPRHFVVQGFSLGKNVDAEVTAKIDPSADGLGDDQTGSNPLSPIDDEDGVVLVGGFLRPGLNTFQIYLSGEGGYLQGWIDFDNLGSFSAGEQIFIDRDLNSGPHTITVNVPESLPIGVNVAARFRWGTIGKTWFGSDILGEVEDYKFETKAALKPGDYNADEVIDTADYSIWKTTFGSTTDLRADGNKNGVIDIGDYTIWRNAKDNPGSGAGGGGGSVAAAGMAPPLPTGSAAGTLSGTPTMLAEVGATLPSLAGAADDSGGAAASGGGAVQYQAESGGRTSSVSESGTVASLHFTTSVSVTQSAVAKPSLSVAAESSDLAILLLSAGYGQSQRVESNGFDDADENLLSDDGERDGDTDLAIAAAFEEECDWRLAL